MAWLVPIFVVGLTVGYASRRWAFCIFGAILELLSLGSWRRAAGVLAAMLFFGIAQMGTYAHANETPGIIFLAGGLIQGVGYYLAMGCPLSILVRLGEGSKYHAVVGIGFIAGVAAYIQYLSEPVSRVLEARPRRGVFKSENQTSGEISIF